MEHIARLGSGNALADVKDISDNEDRENRNLGGNQAIHSHRAARGKIPAEIAFLDGYGWCAHDVTRNANRGLPDASDPIAAGGS